jgi:hypothetical protein
VFVPTQVRTEANDICGMNQCMGRGNGSGWKLPRDVGEGQAQTRSGLNHCSYWLVTVGVSAGL